MSERRATRFGLVGPGQIWAVRVLGLWQKGLAELRQTRRKAEEVVTTVGKLGRPADILRHLSQWRSSLKSPVNERDTYIFEETQTTARGDERARVIEPLDPFVIRQWLWGRGFVTPGDAEHVHGLVKPLGLTSAMSVLDVNAGAGGAARAIAEAFDTYVTGLERDADLAKKGMAMSSAAGLKRRAPVTVIDPESFELRTGAYDSVLSREATYLLLNKERFLRVLIQGMKPRGQLLMTEYVVDHGVGAQAELDTWLNQHPVRPDLWTLNQYIDCLASLGFELRVTEDMTTLYRQQILSGWHKLLSTVELRGMPRPHLIAIVDEAERWMRTVMALDAGVLKIYRLYGLAGKPRPLG